MKPTISSAARTRLALVAFTCLWLSACGGGGGGDTTVAAPAPASAGGPAAPSPSASGSPVAVGPSAPAPAPGAAPTASGSGSPVAAPTPTPPTAVAAAFQPWGPLLVGTADAGSNTSFTSVARLTTGASVVASTMNGVVQAQLIDASGAKVGTSIQIANVSAPPAVQPFSIAPLSNGEWIATWKSSSTTTQLSGGAVMFQRFNAAGKALGGPTQVGEVYASFGSGPVARMTADNGFVIGWSGGWGTTTAPWRAYIARFTAAGVRVAGPTEAGTTPGPQTSVSVNSLSDGTVLVTWAQAPVGQTTSGFTSGLARPFDSSGQPSGPERQFAAGLPQQFVSTSFAGSKVAVVWFNPGQLSWQVLDASGAPVGPAVRSSPGNGNEVRGVAVVDAGGGSFDVLYQTIIQSLANASGYISDQRVRGDGAAEGSPTVVVPIRPLAINSRPAANGQFLPPASEQFSVSGTTDGRYVMSYELVGDTSIEVHALAR